MNITAEDIVLAHQRIQPYIHRAPVLTSATINQVSGASLFFKCENFQKIGAFKIRGGMNAALSLKPEELKHGLATHSSGNHAQAIAYAARELKVKAYIVMPKTSPQVKVDAVKGYGAEISFCEPNQQAREETLKKIVDTTGAAFIHPYDNYQVITGQATSAKELIEDVQDLDYLVAPVGGGGMLSGTLLSAKYFGKQLKVYAAEPEGAADAVLSIKSGKIEKAPFINTIADGLMTTLGDKTLPIIKENVEDVLLVSDDEIKAALRWVYERMKIIVEPSGVVPLAAVLKNRSIFAGKRVGLIFTGGNVDVRKISEWMQ